MINLGYSFLMINMGYLIYFILCLIKGVEFGFEGLLMDFGYWKNIGIYFMGWLSFGLKKLILLRIGNFKLVILVFIKVNMIIIIISICWFEF